MMNPKISPVLMDLLRSIFDYACHQISQNQLLRDTMKSYVPLNFKGKTAIGKRSFEIKEFLTNSTNIALFHGDSGAGKSAFLFKVEEELRHGIEKSEVDAKSIYIPVLIELKYLPKDLDDDFNILKWFLSCQVFKYDKEKQPKVDDYFNILLKHPLVLLLDSFDERSLDVKKAPLLSKLLENVWGRSSQIKIMITCRSLYAINLADYQRNFALVSNGNNIYPMEEYYVSSLDPHQIDRFIENHISLQRETYNITSWDSTKFRTALNSFRNLKALICLPLLLRLILQILPTIYDPYKSENNLTLVFIYSEFIKQWFMREGERSNLEDDINSEDYFSEFSRELAIQMFIENDLDIKYQPRKGIVTERDRPPANVSHQNKWHKFFEREDFEKIRKLSGCPVRYFNGCYSFIHKSFFEYFVAKYFYCELGLNRSHEHQLFQPEKVMDFNFNKKLIREEPSIVSFLAEMIQHNKKNHSQLLEIVYLSRERPQISIAAANAITVVSRVRSLSGEDLRNVNICGADIRGAILFRTQFDNANLEDVWLDDCFLAEANFENTQLLKARFDQNQYIKPSSINVSADSPCGRYTASVSSSDDKSIQVFQISTGLSVKALSHHTDSILKVAHNGKYIISASKDKTIVVCDVETWKPRILKGHTSAVESLAISPRGEYLVSGGADSFIYIWPILNNEYSKKLDNHKGPVLCVVFSPDGTYLASSGSDNTICIYDAKDWYLLNHFNEEEFTHTKSVSCITFSPDETYLVSGSADETARIWWYNGKFWQFLHILYGHSAEIKRIFFSNNGQTLITSSSNETQIWELKNNLKDNIPLWILRNKQATAAHTVWMNCVAFNPLRNQQIAVADGEDKVHIWNIDNKNYITPLQAHSKSSWVEYIEFSSTGKYLASANGDASVRVWDASDWNVLVTLRNNSQEMWSVSFSLNEKLIAASSEDKTINIWRTGNWSHLGTLIKHQDGVLCVAFSPDEKYLFSGSKDKYIYIWSREDWKVKNEINLGIMVKCLAFGPRIKPNGDYLLAVGTINNRIFIYKISEGKAILVKELLGHDDRDSAILRLVFAKKGKYLISGSGDKTFRIWDVESGDCLQIVKELRSVFSIAVSPDEEYLAVTYPDSIVQLWSFYENKEKKLQCKLVWCTYSYFNCQDANFKNVKGLSQKYHKILNSYGANVTLNTDLSENNKALPLKVEVPKHVLWTSKPGIITKENAMPKPRLTSIIFNGNPREVEIFQARAQENYTWRDILNSHVFDHTIPSNEREGSEFIVQKLKRARDGADRTLYMKAIQRVFGDDKLTDDRKCFSYQERENKSAPKNDLTGFKLEYYDVEIWDKRKKGSPILTVSVVAPGSRDLTSDIDISLKIVCHSEEGVRGKINWPYELGETEQTKDADLEMLILAAIIFNFNKINCEDIGFTSAESRDTNIYIDGFMHDLAFIKYPDFIYVDGGNKKSGIEAIGKNKHKYYEEYKNERQILELAASLVSLRQYYAENKDGFQKIFSDHVATSINPLGLNQANFEEIMKKVATEVENLYQYQQTQILAYKNAANLKKDYLNYCSQAMQKVITEQSILIKSDRGNDFDIYVNNILYSSHLLEVAKIRKLIKDSDFKKTESHLVDLNKLLIDFDTRLNAARLNLTLPDMQGARSAIEEQLKKLEIEKADFYSKKFIPALEKFYVESKELSRLLGLQQRALIKAHLFAVEAYINYSAPYHTVLWQQSGKDNLHIDRRRVVLCSVLQQIGFRLLHAKHYRSLGMNEGEILYRVAKYGQRVADVLFGDKKKWFGDIEFTINDNSPILIRFKPMHEHALKAKIFSSKFYNLINLHTALVRDIKKADLPTHQKGRLAKLLYLKRYLVEQEGRNKHDVDLTDEKDLLPILDSREDKLHKWLTQFFDEILINSVSIFIAECYRSKIFSDYKESYSSLTQCWGTHFKLKKLEQPPEELCKLPSPVPAP